MFFILKTCYALASMAHLAGASSHKPKGHGFDSRSGHIPRLRVWSLVGVHTRGHQTGWLRQATNECFSLTSTFLSLSFPFLLSKVSKYVLR